MKEHEWEIAMIDANHQASIRSLSGDATISSRIACTEHVRVEFLRCGPQATVQWDAARPDVSLLCVSDKGSQARITVAGRAAEDVAPGLANFWFFPAGVGAHGEVTGNGRFDCAAITVDPEFLPPPVQRVLDTPLAGFWHEELGRTFDGLANELNEPDDVLPLLTDGWAMQALAYVARATRAPERPRAGSTSGLAPWQLRRAKEIMLRNLSEPSPMQQVAQACKLSIGHFSRGFKVSTGVPPHRWLLTARVEKAKRMLAGSLTPLVEIAGTCGFADQSHFSRVFADRVGSSPGVWRRNHQA